jgi:hypothetical protein
VAKLSFSARAHTTATPIRPERETASEGVPVPSRRTRAWLAIAAAVLSGMHALTFVLADSRGRDFDQTWYAVHALFRGRNPYLEIGPGLAFNWGEHFYYPLTAAVAISPLAWLPHLVATPVFAALSAAAFVWASTRTSLAPAVVITSASAAMASETVQWSPLLAAAYGIPWLGVILSAKPTIGLAIFAARPSRMAVLGSLVLIAIALLFLPTWPLDWIHAVRNTSVLKSGGTTYAPPIRTIGGAFALVAILRWRRPEARLLLALACVPQTPLLYETVPLFLVPATILEGGVLWLGSWLAALTIYVAAPSDFGSTRFPVSANAIGVFLYLPCAVMILRRPNRGNIPQRLERWLSGVRLPRGIVGESDTPRHGNGLR